VKRPAPMDRETIFVTMAAERGTLVGRLEAQLAAGVYQREPRKGRPLDSRDRRVKREWLARLRANLELLRDAERRATLAEGVR
jgi:hypothetical protein